MKSETILENCNRIMQFYKCDPIGLSNSIEESPLGLLKAVSYVLDWNGASDNMALVFLNSEEYLELNDWLIEKCINIGTAGAYHQLSVFKYDGYRFTIIDEGRLKSERQRIKNIILNNEK